MPPPKHKRPLKPRAPSALTSSYPRAQGVVPIGPHPDSPKHAWRALSKEAKVLLWEERQSGRYGGTPGEAPYWILQDRGDEEVLIKPQFFIDTAMKMAEPQIVNIVDSFLRG